jgi:hypothetical protein
MTEPAPVGFVQTQRVVIIVAAIAGALATFLPWINVPIVGSVPGTAGDGWITLGISAFAALLSLGRGQISIAPRVLIVLAGMAMAAIGGFDALGVVKAKAEMGEEAGQFGEVMAKAVTVGAGLYLVIAAGLALIAGALAGPSQPDPRATREPLPAVVRVLIFILLAGATGAGVYALTWVKEGGLREKQIDKPASSPCGEIDGLEVCIERAEERYVLSNTFDRTKAHDGSAFLLLQLKIANTGKESRSVSAAAFELRNGSEERFKPDLNTDFAAHMAGFKTLSSGDIPPGYALQGWLSFHVPAPSITGAELRMKKGSDGLNLLLPSIAGAPCSANGERGMCIDVNRCEGSGFYDGICPGPKEVKCCVK